MNKDFKKKDDSILIKYVAQGNRAAFNTIYYRYWESLFRSVYAVLHDKDLSLDVVQEVFIWFWENRKKWTITNLKPYLNAAVKYKIANTIRHNKIHIRAIESIAITQQDEVFNLEDELEVRELKAVILDFTNQLPSRCQQIFRMSRFEQLSNKEIAKKLGISEKTVENQITIALKKLKVDLGKLAFWLIFLI
ncbi:RNA polymerase sigma factor [Membranihabitans marinus]|uniref:RNA polymerase sigma factor n=1 Tax=Membranihabitans marinus TaxID=1227546 RepID=UPI001F00D72F|nr:RNA polymerase sigma-70 factor [Membranihabitans marinus]